MFDTGQRKPPPTKPPVAHQFFDLTRLPNDRCQRDWDGLLGIDETKSRILKSLTLGAWLREVGISRAVLARGNAILLVGPPGTGKSALASGCGHMLALANGQPAFLIEVKTHDLPSANKGGTQQNITKLFRDIAEVAACGLPTIVVINEVESVCGNRATISSETNPVDAIYAVNAFIESWDSIVREHPNVMFVTTSNLLKALDRAVIDRCDFTITTDLPPAKAREVILLTALEPVRAATFAYRNKRGNGRLASRRKAKPDLSEVVRKSEGMSPRELRKLVFRALTFPDHPSQFAMDHLLMAIDDYVAQRRHHAKNGGVYIDDYQRNDQA